MATEVIILEFPEDDTLQEWFRPLLEHGTAFAAPNLDTTLAFLKAGEIELPLTVNEAEWENSWICSPWTHYVSYAREEIARATGKGTARISGTVLAWIGRWLRRANFNRVVMVNNWLLSTNPWPQWDARELPNVLAALTERWPDHAIVFRSLNYRECTPLIEALDRAGALLVPSRQVWWYDAGSTKVSGSPDFRKDVKLLRRDDLEIVTDDAIQDDDFPCLTRLYEQLYLEKYSRYNPQFTESWFRHLHSRKLVRFTALRTRDGEFVGVEGCSLLHGVLTSPVVGYDLDQPRSLALYRRLAVIPILEAQRLGVPLNLSSGVGRFKALRGGAAVMEYLAVYDRHLPRRRRLPWRFVHLLSTRLLAPYVRRKRL